MNSDGKCPKRDISTRVDPDYSNECCVNLGNEFCCNPDPNSGCQKERNFDETAIAADMGLYFQFNSHPDTGLPYGCPGFDNVTAEGELLKNQYLFAVST